MYNRPGELEDQRRLWAITWKINLNLPKTNSPKIEVRATQSWSVVSYVTTKRNKRSLWGTSWRNFISKLKYSKIEFKNIFFYRNKFLTIISKKNIGIHRSKTSSLDLKVCYLTCTCWSSGYQISNFKFSAFFRVLFALCPQKYPHPKSQQTPCVSTELEMVMNSANSFILLQKLWEKSGHKLVENPRKRAENTMALNGKNLNWSRACVDKRLLCSTSHRGLRWHQTSQSINRNDAIHVAKDSTPMMLF